jgi:5-methyltetrahydrofolate--homocysteine methyltransferase
MTDWLLLQQEMEDILLNGDVEHGIALASSVLQQGGKPVEFFQNGIIPPLTTIGKKFEDLEIFLPELVIAAETVQQINDRVIKPAIEASKTEGSISAGKVLLATVKGDLHDIGKNMVALMLRINGFEVIDLGISVDPTEIVHMAEVEQVDIIGMSSLLTTCLPYMKDVIDFLSQKNIRGQYHIIVGGAAVNPDFCRKIGADEFGKSATEAVVLCNNVMSKRL